MRRMWSIPEDQEHSRSSSQVESTKVQNSFVLACRQSKLPRSRRRIGAYLPTPGNEVMEDACGLCSAIGLNDELHYFIECDYFKPLRHQLFPKIRDLPQVFYLEMFRNIFCSRSRGKLSNLVCFCKKILDTKIL